MTSPELKLIFLRQKVADSLHTRYPLTELEKKFTLFDPDTKSVKVLLQEYEVTAVFAHGAIEVFEQHTPDIFKPRLLINVLSMQVNIYDGKLSAECQMHIHKPRPAFITFSYTYENSLNNENPRLVLAAKVKTHILIPHLLDQIVYRALDVNYIAQNALKDPQAIIKKTLPDRLIKYGVAAEIDRVNMKITDENQLEVVMHGNFSSLDDPQHNLI